ncbi:hypothetical protein M9458_051465, partial [Cirrhinus mrigala]
MPDDRQSGMNEPIETVEEPKQSGEQDGLKASSSNMSQVGADLLVENSGSQVNDSDLD